MKNIGQLFVGLLSAVASSLLVLSAVSLALVEGRIDLPTPVLPTPSLTASVPVVLVSTQTLAPAPEFTATGTVKKSTATPTETQAPQPTLCAAPDGWMPYTVQAGDDIQSIARQTGAAVEQILQGNCLVSETLLPGTILYLPFIEPTHTVPPALPTAVPCGPPAGWIRYTVQPYDTLFRIAQAYGISVYQLQFANCMTGTTILAGSRLYVPNGPTLTPRATRTPTATPSPTEAPTLEPTWTTQPTATKTHTPRPVWTATKTSTPTQTATNTATATATHTATATATATATNTATATSTATMPSGVVSD